MDNEKDNLIDDVKNQVENNEPEDVEATVEEDTKLEDTETALEEAAASDDTDDIYEDKEKRSESIKKFFEENNDTDDGESFLGAEGEALGKKGKFWSKKNKIIATVGSLFVFGAIVYACSISPIFDKEGNMIEYTTVEEITDETTEFYDESSTETTTDILRPTEATTKNPRIKTNDKFSSFASKHKTGTSSSVSSPVSKVPVSVPSVSGNSTKKSNTTAAVKPNKTTTATTKNNSKPVEATTIPVDKYITINNKKLSLGTDIASVKEILGEPDTALDNVSEVTTIEIESTEDVTNTPVNTTEQTDDSEQVNSYQYKDFSVQTKVENGKEVVKNIKITTNNIKNQAGFSPIGQDIYNISLKYGAPTYEDTSVCRYKIDDNSYVYFTLDNGKISEWGIASK